MFNLGIWKAYRAQPLILTNREDMRTPDGNMEEFVEYKVWKVIMNGRESYLTQYHHGHCVVYPDIPATSQPELPLDRTQYSFALDYVGEWC